MNFNVSPIAYYTSRAAQPWRAWFYQRKVAVVVGENLPPFVINDTSTTAPDTVEIYNAYDDTLAATRTGVSDILAHTSTVDGQSVNSWIYQGTSAGIFGFTTAGYYYLKIGSYYSDVIKFGEIAGDYVQMRWQTFDDIITVDGTLLSKYVEHKLIFETNLWHPSYEVKEEGKENNGIYYQTSRTLTKKCGFSAIVNEAELDSLYSIGNGDKVTIEARQNGVVKSYETNQIEVKDTWQSDDVASVNVEFDLFNIVRKYQKSENAPAPLPIPTPPPTPSNYYLKGKTQSGVSSIKLNINGTLQTIAVTNGEFVFGYDTPISTLRTSVDSGDSNPDTALQNCDKITELDLSESDGFGTATSVVLNSLANCTTIKFGACIFAALTTINKMFDSDKKLTSVNMPSATFASVTQGSLMFADCVALTSVSMPNAVLKVGAYGMFIGCTNLASIDLRACTFEDETSTGVMFCECKKIGQSTFRFDAATFASVTDCARMFDNAIIADAKTSFIQLFPAWAAQPTSVARMFNESKVGPLFSLSAIDTTACTDFSGFLSNVTGYFKIDALDFSAATDLSNCFDGTTFDENWLTWLASQTFAAAENISYMFRNSMKNSAQAAAFTAATFANVTNATGMFEDCNEQKEIDLSAATFASLTTATNMFSGCTDLENVDLSAAEFASVTDASGMFNGCSKLKTLTVPSSAKMAVNFGLAQSSLLLVASFDNISVWAKDLSGLSGKTITLNATAVAGWQSVPAQNIIYAAAKSLLESKNWTVQ